MDWADWLFRFLPVREKDKYQFVGDFSHSEERRIRRKLHRPPLEIEETVRWETSVGAMRLDVRWFRGIGGYRATVRSLGMVEIPHEFQRWRWRWWRRRNTG